MLYIYYKLSQMDVKIEEIVSYQNDCEKKYELIVYDR